jgi:hypothetical protein
MAGQKKYAIGNNNAISYVRGHVGVILFASTGQDHSYRMGDMDKKPMQ